MKATPPFSFLLIGHVTKDLQSDNSYTVGGTVTYGAVVAKNLGWLPLVVTAAAPDFERPAFLADVEWRAVASPHTTTFRNEYDAGGNRQQTIGPVARSIGIEHIPPAYRQASLAHLCPLCRELEPSLVTIFDRSQLVSTPQGWMRRWDARGRVSRGEWESAGDILPQLRAAVISIEDVEGNWSIAGRWAAQIETLVVTQGAAGCTVFHRGRRFTVPPRPCRPIDPTGAGDIFATAFFICLHESGDVWHAAQFANVTASMALERPGPRGAPLRQEVEQYLVTHSAQI